MARRGGHGSAPVLGVSAKGVPYMHPLLQSQLSAMTIDSLQPGHMRPPSGYSPGWTDHLRDHSAYRIGPWEPRQQSKGSQLVS